MEAFSISCQSLDGTEADRNPHSDAAAGGGCGAERDGVQPLTPQTPFSQPGNPLFFQNPRTLGKGLDTFDVDGFPQTPVIHVSTPPIAEGLALVEEAPFFDLLSSGGPSDDSQGAASGDHLMNFPTFGSGVTNGSVTGCGSRRGGSCHLHSPRHPPFSHQTFPCCCGGVQHHQQMVLLRGATSFSGAHILAKLLQQGFHVRILAKDCPTPSAIRDIKALAQSCVPNGSGNRLFVFRGDDLCEALLGCDFVVCNSDPDTGDLSSYDAILKRYRADLQDLFLSIHRVCSPLLHPPPIPQSSATGSASSRGHRDRMDAADYTATPPTSLNGSRTQYPSTAAHHAANVPAARSIIRVVWVTTVATLFPVETTSCSKERQLIRVKAHMLREAQSIAKQIGVPMVVLLPSIVVGVPLTAAKDEAHFMLAKIARGSAYVPLAPKMHWNFVDVRDVADAVFAAMVSESAVGQRYIVSERELRVSHIGLLLRKHFPRAQQLSPPRYDMPNVITLLLCFAGCLGEDVSYQYLKQNLSRSFVLSHKKAKRDLKMTFRSAEAAIVDTVAHMFQIKPCDPQHDDDFELGENSDPLGSTTQCVMSSTPPPPPRTTGLYASPMSTSSSASNLGLLETPTHLPPRQVPSFAIQSSSVPRARLSESSRQQQKNSRNHDPFQISIWGAVVITSVAALTVGIFIGARS